VLRAN
jgi:hypothetical protein